MISFPLTTDINEVHFLVVALSRILPVFRFCPLTLSTQNLFNKFCLRSITTCVITSTAAVDPRHLRVEVAE